MLYLINFTILSQTVPIFHVSLSIIYQLDLILRLYIIFFQDSCIQSIKKGILACYFYLVYIIYYFYLTKINQFISISYPNQVYDRQRKNISQW